MVETAIILAAGRGSRLDPGGQAEDFSKPLVELGGRTLLSRAIDASRIAGARRILVVTGYRAERVAAEVARLDRGDLTVVFNDQWQKSNGLSVYACRDQVPGDFALMMADHIFEPSILRDMMALERPEGSVVLAVDYKIDQVFDLDDATKVRVQDGRIAAISKQLDRYDAVDCGVFVCAPAIFDALGQVYAARGDSTFSEGASIIADRGLFLSFDIGDRLWQDVDTPEMKGNALALLERIDAGSG